MGDGNVQVATRVRGCLNGLRTRGRWIGVIGNIEIEVDLPACLG